MLYRTNTTRSRSRSGCAEPDLRRNPGHSPHRSAHVTVQRGSKRYDVDGRCVIVRSVAGTIPERVRCKTPDAAVAYAHGRGPA